MAVSSAPRDLGRSADDGTHRTRRLVRANLTLFGLAGGWLGLDVAGFGTPELFGWIFAAAAFGITGYAAFLAAHAPGAPPAARRFWRQLGIVIALVGSGSALMTWSTVTTGTAAKPIPVAALTAVPIMGAGVLLAMWALLRLPLGRRSGGEWLRLTLDAATVTLGAALFMWHLLVRPQLATDAGTTAMLVLLLLSVVCLVGLVSVVKVMLVGSESVDRGALRFLAVTLLFGGVSAVVVPLVARADLIGLQQLSSTVDALLVCWAAHCQYRATRVAEPRTPRRAARPYSLLPYAGVAATDALLASVTISNSDDAGVVTAGAIVVTGIVVLRQILAFRDNALLLSSLRQHEQRLRHQASHDALTQLANRTVFGENVTAALAADGHSAGLAVFVIDLDDFKTINDTLGHAIGDGVLLAVAGRLREAVRADDVVARLGGDEFAVLLRDAPGDDVLDAAERMLAILTRPVSTSGHQLLVRASIGVAQPRPGDGLDELLRNADIAMYAAKERGRCGYVRYTPDLSARILAHAELGAALREAIGTDQMFLLYQPIVRLSDGAIVGTEALLRWRHPVRGLISPVEFIPTAEQTGLIVPLGRWVLQQACRQAADWVRRYGDRAPYSVNVNVAGRQLNDPGFLADVTASLASSELAAEHLVIEMTETAALQGVETIATLHALRELDIRLALDDFGTAASSLGLLLTCPVSTLKLDRSFIEQITTVRRQAAVATAVIHIAEALDLEAVAEGIENTEQVEILQRLGYRKGQGFFFARPLTPAELEAMLPPPIEPAATEPALVEAAPLDPAPLDPAPLDPALVGPGVEPAAGFSVVPASSTPIG